MSAKPGVVNLAPKGGGGQVLPVLFSKEERKGALKIYPKYVKVVTVW